MDPSFPGQNHGPVRPKQDAPDVLRLGVSRCLLGERVRYDGQHKSDPWVTGDHSDQPVHWVGVCPEVEMGMEVPREPVQLEGEKAAPRMRGVKSRVDHSCDMHHWAGEKLTQLGAEDLDGFVLKSRSPSCGVLDTELFGDNGLSVTGRVDGLFTAALRHAFPFLPLTTEIPLATPEGRALFLRRARIYRRFKKVIALGSDPTTLRLVHEEARQALEDLGHVLPDSARGGRLQLLETAFRRTVESLDSEHAHTKELTTYGQLLHDLLDPGPGF